jgi:hypothetical protein
LARPAKSFHSLHFPWLDWRAEGQPENFGRIESIRNEWRRYESKNGVRKVRSSHARLEFVPFEGSKYFIPAIMGNRRRTWYFAGMAVPHYKKRQIESGATAR